MFKLFGGSKKTETVQERPLEKAVSTQSSPLEEEKSTGFEKLKSAVSLTGKALVGRIVSMGQETGEPFTDEDLETIEETLIRADVGVDMAVNLTQQIKNNPQVRTQENLKKFLREAFLNTLSMGENANKLHYEAGKMNLYLVVGVNGAGKTTLIGKLAHRFTQSGQKVVIAAGDTFRAAAEDQIAIWAQRAGADLVRKDNADAAAVIFDSIQHAKAIGADVLIMDTAGRLQNKFNLMEELRKIKKVIEREAPSDAYCESLVVIDATTGQNALRQAEVFHEAVQLTGVALTKLDGSAKGGIIFNIANQYHLPVKLIGIGEKIEDLRDFDAHAFVDALFES